MIEQSVLDFDIPEAKGLSHLQIIEVELSAHNLQWYGEVRVQHLVVQALLDGSSVGCNRTVNVKLIPFNKSWSKEGKALNVVPVRMGKKHVGFNGHLRKELLPQHPQTRPTIKNKALISHPNFNAGRVAAISYCFWSRTGNTSSNAPEVNRKLVLHARHGCFSQDLRASAHESDLTSLSLQVYAIQSITREFAQLCKRLFA